MKTLRRRRRENKTDYGKRVKLLGGGIPRIVFRKTNKYLIAQYVKSHQAQDKVVFNLNSKELLKYGWPKQFEGSLKSIPAAYLLGLLVGGKINNEKLDNPIFDFGMLRVLHKSRIYGFLKGMIDSGIKINCSEEMFPSEDRIGGKHLRKDFSKIFESIKSKITSS